MAFVVRSTSSASMARSFAKTSPIARLSVVSRAFEQKTTTPWEQEPVNPTISSTKPPKELLPLSDLMKFGGPAPEIINCRLAMVGFVAALGNEMYTADSVVSQVFKDPILISATFLLVTVASLIPMVQDRKPFNFFLFKTNTEIVNGRAAMIGFASLLAIEVLQGSAVFL